MDDKWAREGCCVLRCAEPRECVDVCLDTYDEKCLHEQAVIDELIADANARATERELWREYANLLTDAALGPIQLAHGHGWRCPQDVIDSGERLRAALGIQASQGRHADVAGAGEGE